MDYKVEVVAVPVSDVDRSLAFCIQQVGFTLDVDYRPSDGFRVAQLTPPAQPTRCRSVSGSPTQRPVPRGVCTSW
jgi:hypothetical protein